MTASLKSYFFHRNWFPSYTVRCLPADGLVAVQETFRIPSKDRGLHTGLFPSCLPPHFKVEILMLYTSSLFHINLTLPSAEEDSQVIGKH